MSRNVSNLFSGENVHDVTPVAFTQVAHGGARRPDWATAGGAATHDNDVAVDAAAVLRDAELAEAHASGVEEGRKQVHAEVAAMRERLDNSIAQLGSVRDNILSRTEDDLVELALLIAENLVSGDAEARARFTRNMASQALALLDKAEAIRLRVHPNERAGAEAAVQSAGSETASRVQIVDDISVGAGGVIAECDLGRVDASFAEALRNIARGLTPENVNPRLAAVGTER